MIKFARDPLYRRHRFPSEVISHAVWLYFRFPLSLRMVEDMLATRDVIVSHQTVRLGLINLAETLPMISASDPLVSLETNGISTRLLSPSVGGNIGFGAPLTKTALFLMYWCKAVAIPRLQSV